MGTGTRLAGERGRASGSVGAIRVPGPRVGRETPAVPGDHRPLPYICWSSFMFGYSAVAGSGERWGASGPTRARLVLHVIEAREWA